MTTENQARAWLQTKLANYLRYDHIKGKDSYGSRKKVSTVSKDLHEILDEFDRMCAEASKT